MAKKNKKKTAIIFLTIAIIVFSVVAFFTFKSIDSIENYFYRGMSDFEWTILRYYTGDPGEYLGRDSNTMNGIYQLQGLPKEKYLCAKKFYLYGSGNDVNFELMMNENAVEPIKSIPIRKITVNTRNDSPIIIDDPYILDQLSTLLQNSDGKTLRTTNFNINTKIQLDTDCNLVWSCAIAKHTDGTIRLIGLDQRSNSFQEYDVTEILKGFLTVLN